jgi:hypothetical protein
MPPRPASLQDQFLEYRRLPARLLEQRHPAGSQEEVDVRPSRTAGAVQPLDRLLLALPGAGVSAGVPSPTSAVAPRRGLPRGRGDSAAAGLVVKAVQSTPRAFARATTVGQVATCSPVSSLLTCRVLMPTRSASWGCVRPAASRSSRSRALNHVASVTFSPFRKNRLIGLV